MIQPIGKDALESRLRDVHKTMKITIAQIFPYRSSIHNSILDPNLREATAQHKFQIKGAVVIEFDAAKNQMMIKRRSGERVFTKEK
jgi:hypothetical protein